MRTVDDEREYLEGLLNTRFNYYLVFASLIIVAGFGEKAASSPVGPALFLFGFLVSAVMACSIWRTWALLKVVLDIIVGTRDSTGRKLPKSVRDLTHKGHPYRIAYRRVAPTWAGINANYFLLGAVMLTSLAFLCLFVLALPL